MKKIILYIKLIGLWFKMDSLYWSDGLCPAGASDIENFDGICDEIDARRLAIKQELGVVPKEGDYIELTWLPNKVCSFGVSQNAYMGSKGYVEFVSENGFNLNCGTCIIVVGTKYKFKKLQPEGIFRSLREDIPCFS